MNVRDWRDADRELLQPLYDRGRRGWLRALGWDTSSTLREVEHARTTWGLPGLLAADQAGDIRGWTFFLPDENVLHVGGLSADTAGATSALLDALMDVSDTHGADALSCFMFDEAPGLSPELVRRGFDVEPFLYLARDIGTGVDLPRPASDTQGPPARPWHPDDLDATAVLLRNAYGPEAGRHFAPRDTPAEWERYARNLVQQTACGELNADATRVVGDGADIVGLVLATALAPETAHLAQVVVHPSRRGEGLASALVTEALTIAAGQGFTLATLLVAASNTPARRLYDALGFQGRATFVSARRRTRV